MRVALFPTCVVDAVEPAVGVSTVRLLRRAGHDVVVPMRATCCGQPAWNSGHAAPAVEVARTTLRALLDEDAEAVVVPAGSCATMIRVFWEELFNLAGTPDEVAAVRGLRQRTYELAEFLDRFGAPAAVADDDSPTAYHRSCHMLRELRITDEPERLLAGAGVALTEAPPERCCGFGGTFSVKLPEVSTAMADEVLDAATAIGAERIVGCDASCLLHLRGRADRRGLDLEFRHLATVLDDATATDAATISEADRGR